LIFNDGNKINHGNQSSLEIPSPQALQQSETHVGLHLSVHYFCLILTKTGMCSQILVEFPSVKFHFMDGGNSFNRHTAVMQTHLKEQ
jgi:hypothetical protein